MTMTDDELDGLADRWHAMATLERQALEEAYGAEAVALLQSFVNEVAGQEIIPTPHNANEFADMVVLLRDGEKRWSKRLGDVIIEASQASAGGKVEDAVALLSAFIVACPWRSFRDVADIERWEYF